MKSVEIEDLALTLNIHMDKIAYLDSLLKRAPDDAILLMKLNNCFDEEVEGYFKVKEELLSSLSKYIDKEKEENLPINLSYRNLYKVLRTV